MGKPIHFNILGEKYVLKRELGLLENDLMGRCSAHRKIIEVDARLKGFDYKSTMLHEFVHAVIHESSVNQAIPIQLEEIICDQIAKCLCQNFTIYPKDQK